MRRSATSDPPPQIVQTRAVLPGLPRALPGFAQGGALAAPPLTTGSVQQGDTTSVGLYQRSLVDGRLDAEPAAEATPFTSPLASGHPRRGTAPADMLVELMLLAPRRLRAHPSPSATTVPARSARRCSGTPRRSIYAGGDRLALGASPGQPSRRNFTHFASPTPMHVIRADHELAAAQPSLGSRPEVPAK